MVLAVAALAVLCWPLLRGGGDALTAVIRTEGAERSVPLPEEGMVDLPIRSNGYTLRLILTPEGARVAEADCPTQDCVHTGTITRAGESVVCLPAKVIVRLEGGAPEADGPDVVIG